MALPEKWSFFYVSVIWHWPFPLPDMYLPLTAHIFAAYNICWHFKHQCNDLHVWQKYTANLTTKVWSYNLYIPSSSSSGCPWVVIAFSRYIIYTSNMWLKRIRESLQVLHVHPEDPLPWISKGHFFSYILAIKAINVMLM